MLVEKTDLSIQTLSDAREYSTVGDRAFPSAEYSQISAPVTSEHCPTPAVTISPVGAQSVTVTISQPPPIAVDQKALTLADVLAVLDQRLDLTPNRKRELRSALVRFGKLLHEDLARIPLHIPSLREQLAAINPIAKRIGWKSLQNIRWVLLSAIYE